MSSVPDPHTNSKVQPPPVYDNFFSPENSSFYAKNPYKPLDPLKHQIRLLTMLSRSEDGLPSFAMRDGCALVDFKYTALSYCAGDPKRTAPIYVNGIKFNAFANLAEALKEIKICWEQEGTRFEEQWLWADQICINQSDSNERSHQVNLMRDIYKGANRVLICLTGHKKNVSGMEWAIAIRREQYNRRGIPCSYDRICTCEIPLKSYLNKFLRLESFQEGFLSFFQFLWHPWWTRAWICQEFIHAADAVFLHGGRSMVWKDMASVVLHLSRDAVHTFDAFNTYRKSWSEAVDNGQDESDRLSRLLKLQISSEMQLKQVVALMRKKLDWVEPGDLKEWLKYAGCCKTSDPRDKIFAFLGLAWKGYDISAEYSTTISMEAVLIDVTRKILEFEGNLNFLHYVHYVSGESAERRLESLPSWVPDWTHQPTASDSIYDTSDINNPRATLQPDIPKQFYPKIIQGSILQLSGVKIDIIGNDIMGQRGDWHWTRKRVGIYFESDYGMHDKKSSDALWYFPGNPGPLVLRPKDDYWLFMSTTQLLSGDVDEEDEDWGLYCLSVARLMKSNDLDGLLRIEGLKLEVIDIH